MSLDDILRFLFILIFFIVPIIRAVTRRNQPPPPKAAPPKPVAGPATTGGSPVVNVPTSTVTTTTLSTDFEKKLAEARRKVQEAMQQGGLLQPETTKDIGQESAEGMFQQPATKPIPRVFSDPAPGEFQQKAQTKGSAIPEISHKVLTVAPPLQKATLGLGKHAKLDKQILLSKEMLSEQELTRGLIWLQILSEPKSKQQRRNLSQHR